MKPQQIREYLDARQDELLEHLCRFIEIPSVSGDLENVKRALDFILELGKSFGFQTASLLNGQIGIIEVGQGDEVLGILAHVDVVAPGDPSAWITNPFEPLVKDGSLFGRGTLDDKGAIIASLYAMKAAADGGEPFHKKVRLILGTQEEVDWSDMRAYVDNYPLPDYGFTPDGEFPVCNIEKGGLDADLLFPLEPPEEAPDGTYVTGIHAGIANNVIPGSCTAQLTTGKGAQLSTCTVRTTGKAVHSCQPEKGENAIFSMAAELKSRHLAGNQLLDLLFMTEEKFSDIFGHALGLYSESEYYNGEFVHRNVLSPTLMKIRDNEVQIHVNARFGYGTDPHTLLGRLEALAQEYGGRVDHVSVLPAVYVSRERPFLHAFAEAYREITGMENQFVLAYGGSYAKAMPNIVSWGPIFPGEEDTCHEENEHIPIKSLMDNAAVFASAIGKIVFSKDSFR